MHFGETLVFYLVIGLGVAVAACLSDVRTIGLGRDHDAEQHRRARLAFVALSAVLFWPLYLPLLLSSPVAPVAAPAHVAAAPQDEMAEAIAQVELELDAALSSLDGWAEDVLVSEKDRIGELRLALLAQACRIREMDSLLARAKTAGGVADFSGGASPLAAAEPRACDRRQQSERARAQNMARLEDVRRRAHADLLGTLAWIRELVSMIHLAKFTGAPASRAEELVAQIAAAVEGISAADWREESHVAQTPRPLRPAVSDVERERARGEAAAFDTAHHQTA